VVSDRAELTSHERIHAIMTLKNSPNGYVTGITLTIDGGNMLV